MGTAGESRLRPGDLIAAGRTSDVYEFGAGAVVKVPRPDVPDHWALLEASLTAAIGALDVPAPSVIDVTMIDGLANRTKWSWPTLEWSTSATTRFAEQIIAVYSAASSR